MAVHTSAPALKAARKRPLLGFADSEKIDGVPNEELPLVVIVGIHGHDIARCLVDEGNSLDNLYQDAFDKLGMRKEDLKSYEDTDLHCFNKTSTRPWRYVKIGVTFGEEADERRVEGSILVIPIVSVYNFILGSPTLAELDAVISTVHLKMKYHNKRGDVVTIHADLDDAKRCHKVWEKLPVIQSASILKGTRDLGTIPWCPMSNCNNADLDVCHEEKHPKKRKRTGNVIPHGSKTALRTTQA